ncbi:MAG: hypothetical protein V3S29_01245, partial [bacterium]
VLDLQRRHFPAGGDVLVPACGRGHEAVFLAGRWRAGGPWPQPRDPRRPGPEYTASFTKLS